MLPDFLKAGALAFSSDATAVEAMNFLLDRGIGVPEQISVAGFDDSLYARISRPRLTTVHQDVKEKAQLSVSLLLKLIRRLPIEKLDHKNPVRLVCRESVKCT